MRKGFLKAIKIVLREGTKNQCFVRQLNLQTSYITVYEIKTISIRLVINVLLQQKISQFQCNQ